MKIIGYRLRTAKLQLKKPYVLSFTTVCWIDSVLVELILDTGGHGLGEAVPLPGYSHETVEGITQVLASTLPNIINMDVLDVADYLSGLLSDHQFALSAVLTAKEFAAGEVTLPQCLEVPLLAAVTADSDAGRVLNLAQGLNRQGYATIKLKTGRDIRDDCQCLSLLLKELPAGVKLRVDANQAYTPQEAARLAAIISSHNFTERLECFEQPFHPDDWDDFCQLTKEFPQVPFMLDESIISDHHVEKAAEVGAKLVKLKLFKHPGITGVIKLADSAKQLGMQVVLGNGVSSDVGNLVEAMIFQKWGGFLGDSEGNGFDKLCGTILSRPPIVERGRLLWERPIQSSPWDLSSETAFREVQKDLL